MRMRVHSLIFGLALSGCLGGCGSVGNSRLSDDVLPPAVDLVAEARAWRRAEGLVVAREKLDARLQKMDANDGMFEKRMWSVNADKSWVYPDSLATIPRPQRSQVGIFLMLGFRQTGKESPAIIARVAESLRAEGWHAELMAVPNRGTAAEDAARIHEVLSRELPKVKRAVLVGFSKGGYDLIEWMRVYGKQLPIKERRKIRLAVNFAGALRGSAVAAWGAGDPALAGAAFRKLLVMQAGQRPDGHATDLQSIARDPWLDDPTWRPRSVLPRLRAIQYVVLPEGSDGRSRRHVLFSTIGRLAERNLGEVIGPMDGLVESAAQVYPEQVGVPQWIVRVLGSHATLDGKYANGAWVSAQYHRGGRAGRLASGGELMQDFLRAVPQRWVGM